MRMENDREKEYDVMDFLSYVEDLPEELKDEIKEFILKLSLSRKSRER